MPQDTPKIIALLEAAFPEDAEARLTERLIQDGDDALSLVAEKDDIILAHILYSPLTLPDFSDAKLLALAPLAVLPDYQKKGIGEQLTKESLHILTEQKKWQGVLVLGDPAYYSRFGFVAAVKWQLLCPYPVPSEAFQGLELQPKGLENIHGTVEYAPAFSLL